MEWLHRATCIDPLTVTSVRAEPSSLVEVWVGVGQASDGGTLCSCGRLCSPAPAAVQPGVLRLLWYEKLQNESKVFLEKFMRRKH